MLNPYSAPLTRPLQADGPALTASTTPTSLLGSTTSAAAARPTILANDISEAGKTYLVRAAGQISNIVTTPGTLTLDIRFGSVIVATSVINLNVVAKTNVPWKLEWELTARTVGGTTTAQVYHQGMFISESVIGSPLPNAGSAGIAMLPNATPGLGTGFDSTAAALLVDFFGTWSLNNANSIQCRQFSILSVN